MDIIQRTVSFFSALLTRFRMIGDILRSTYLPVINESEEKTESERESFFWIFNW